MRRISRCVALRSTLLFVFMHCAAYAQGAYPPSCGPAESRFHVDDGPSGGPSTAPVTGKAAVYLIGFFNLAKGNAAPTIRLGQDGEWLGATKHNSYLRIEVEPGIHHYCAAWQSILKGLSGEISLLNLDAAAGKTYYLRAAAHADAAVGGATYPYIDLQPVSEDEGQFLLSRSVLAVSRQER